MYIQQMKGFVYVALLLFYALVLGSCGSEGGQGDCYSHDACDEENLCISGECVLAYGRRYHITIESVQVSDYNQTGEPWDFPGGMPDPFVCVDKNNETEFCTSVKQDTFEASFNEGFEADIYSEDEWSFRAIDEDLSAHDIIETVYLDPVGVDVIKAGGFSYEGTYLLSIDVAIEPKE